MRYLVLVLVMATSCAWGQAYRCDSMGATTTGTWKPLAEAPHDGTLVEELNAYGVAPSYGVFKFTGGHWIAVDPSYQKYSPGAGLISEVCQWFRPFTGDLAKYVDPTNGAQWTVKYECDAMHLRYSKKTDRCILR